MSDKTDNRNRNNHSKLITVLTFLATTPDAMLKAADTKALKEAAAAGLAAYLEEPATAALFKRNQEAGLIDKDGNLTGTGQSDAQASLNARPGRPGGKMNFEATVRSMNLSAMIALQRALTKEFSNFFNNPEVNFTAQGQSLEMFKETITLFEQMCGFDPAGFEEEEPVEEVVTGEV